MMPGKSIRILLPVLALCAGIAAAACGTVATPEWAAEAQSTQAALLATSEHLTEIAPTATPTTPPTATPVPPTATPTTVPPTEAPTEAPTAVPTEEVTVEATAETAASSAEITGDPVNGETVFNTPYVTANGTWSCAQCHSVLPGEMRLIGPGLWNISVRAETRVEGQSAYDYIHQSIVDPNAVIAPGDPPYPANLMPQNWEEVLTPEELNDVIAYLYTLND
jgi:mono/diheme cytochrome c family protein